MKRCCKSACPDCPFGFQDHELAEKPLEFLDPWSDKEEETEIYEGEIPEEEEL